MNMSRAGLTFIAGFALAWSINAAADTGDKPWMNPALEPDQRAELAVAQMTREEKQGLVFGYFGTDAPWKKYTIAPEARQGSAGYVPGMARLGIPPQWQADAGIGVATQGGAAVKRARTALPSGLAAAASWDPEVAFRGGAMIGAEARADGFNVLLGGSVNLMREPRNGRNFEYAGEDPLLAGTMVGARSPGIQSNQIVSTVKHFAVNDQETDRNNGNAILEERARRGCSDLLAFQFAIERGEPGSVMCSYNRVGGDLCVRERLPADPGAARGLGLPGLRDVGLGRRPFDRAGRQGGARPGVRLAAARRLVRRRKLRAALAAGEISEEQIDLMAARILRSMFAHGLIDRPVSEGQPIDFAAHRAVSQAGAEAGIVLLKNERATAAARGRRRTDRGDRRARRQGRAVGRRIEPGLSRRRQRGAGARADRLARAGRLLSLVAARGAAPAAAQRDHRLRRRDRRRRGRAARATRPTSSWSSPPSGRPKASTSRSTSRRAR